jgi:hypothetical protein
MKPAFAFILCFFACSYFCQAQNAFGVNAGYILQGRGGLAEGKGGRVAQLTGSEIFFIGGFYQHEMTDGIALRTELNYYGNPLQVIVPGQRPEEPYAWHNVSIGNVYYTTLELPVMVSVKIPIIRNFGVGLLGGVGLDINIRSGKAIDYSFGGPTPATTEIMHTLADTPKTLVANYTGGVRFDVWRLTLIARCQRNLSASLTNDFDLWGNEYTFHTHAIDLHFSVCYNVYWVGT